jgi:hypothetical protein
MSKNSNKILRCASGHPMLEHKSFAGKKTFYMAYVKKINRCLVVNFFRVQKIVFFAQATEINIFSRPIEHVKVHPDFFSEIFDILKYVFSTIGASTRMSQSGFPVCMCFSSTTLAYFL